MKLLRMMMAVLLLCGVMAGRAEEKAVINVGPEEAAALLAKNTNVVVLDIRTAKEFQEGHLKGATNVDFYADDFKEKLKSLDKSKTYLLHCASGGRSSQARETMKEMKFQSLYHLDGGFKAWQKASKPVEK
ncbi:MAG: rhodanese-like domain-containing protein [Verrucomicrobiota bacterium]|nr:rhodanese-like domain-containing protein [Verrucomicrobiota bacterium]